LQYSFKTVATDQYVFEVCSPSPAYLNTTFSFTELNHFLISKSVVRVWDARRNVSVFVLVQGSGELTFLQKAFYKERKQYIFFQNKPFNDYVMANEPKFQNWASEDFLNMSLPANGSTSGIN
jgi:hypothetical protein